MNIRINFFNEDKTKTSTANLDCEPNQSIDETIDYIRNNTVCDNTKYFTISMGDNDRSTFIAAH